MTDKPSIENNYEVDGEVLTLRQVALALYHISQNNVASGELTLKYVRQVQRVAADILFNVDELRTSQFNVNLSAKEAESLLEQLETDWKEIKQTPLTVDDQSICSYHGFDCPNPYSRFSHICPSDPNKVCRCCDEGEKQCMDAPEKPYLSGKFKFLND